MNSEYEKKMKMNSCGIEKSHEIRIIVRETSSKTTPNEDKMLWTKTGISYGTMRAVIKAIYTALPKYRGKRLDIEVWNKTTGLGITCWGHHVPLNRIPRQL
jgi:hypothetical protein